MYSYIMMVMVMVMVMVMMIGDDETFGVGDDEDDDCKCVASMVNTTCHLYTCLFSFAAWSVIPPPGPTTVCRCLLQHASTSISCRGSKLG